MAIITAASWARSHGFSRQYAHQLIQAGIIPMTPQGLNKQDADKALKDYQSPQRRLSQRAYGKHRGVSEASVRKAIKTGRITPNADGTIDAFKADVEWERNTMHRRSSDINTDVPEGPSISTPSTYLQAKTAHEVLKAQASKVKLQSLKGSLIDREKAANHVFALARALRDSWLNWPTRVAGTIAAELRVDEHELTVILENAVREHLTELGTITPRFEADE